MSSMRDVIFEGEAPETDDEGDEEVERVQTAKSSTIRPQSIVIDGEAPESDDERVEEKESAQRKQTDEESLGMQLKGFEKVHRARVHVDEKLDQRWRNLGADAVTVQWRRQQAAMKMASDCEKMQESTFTTMQSSAVLVRSVTDQLCRLHSLTSQLAQGAGIVPEGLKNTVQIPKF